MGWFGNNKRNNKKDGAAVTVARNNAPATAGGGVFRRRKKNRQQEDAAVTTPRAAAAEAEEEVDNNMHVVMATSINAAQSTAPPPGTSLKVQSSFSNRGTTGATNNAGVGGAAGGVDRVLEGSSSSSSSSKRNNSDGLASLAISSNVAAATENAMDAVAAAGVGGGSTNFSPSSSSSSTSSLSPTTTSGLQSPSTVSAFQSPLQLQLLQQQQQVVDVTCRSIGSNSPPRKKFWSRRKKNKRSSSAVSATSSSQLSSRGSEDFSETASSTSARFAQVQPRVQQDNKKKLMSLNKKKKQQQEHQLDPTEEPTEDATEVDDAAAAAVVLRIHEPKPSSMETTLDLARAVQQHCCSNAACQRNHQTKKHVTTLRGSATPASNYHQLHLMSFQQQQFDQQQSRVLDKTGDRYEFAYQVWHERGLLSWRPKATTAVSSAVSAEKDKEKSQEQQPPPASLASCYVPPDIVTTLDASSPPTSNIRKELPPALAISPTSLASDSSQSVGTALAAVKAPPREITTKSISAVPPVSLDLHEEDQEHDNKASAEAIEREQGPKDTIAGISSNTYAPAASSKETVTGAESTLLSSPPSTPERATKSSKVNPFTAPCSPIQLDQSLLLATKGDNSNNNNAAPVVPPATALDEQQLVAVQVASAAPAEIALTTKPDDDEKAEQAAAAEVVALEKDDDNDDNSTRKKLFDSTSTTNVSQQPEQESSVASTAATTTTVEKNPAAPESAVVPLQEQPPVAAVATVSSSSSLDHDATATKRVQSTPIATAATALVTPTQESKSEQPVGSDREDDRVLESVQMVPDRPKSAEEEKKDSSSPTVDATTASSEPVKEMPALLVTPAKPMVEATVESEAVAKETSDEPKEDHAMALDDLLKDDDKQRVKGKSGMARDQQVTTPSTVAATVETVEPTASRDEPFIAKTESTDTDSLTAERHSKWIQLVLSHKVVEEKQPESSNRSPWNVALKSPTARVRELSSSRKTTPTKPSGIRRSHSWKYKKTSLASGTSRIREIPHDDPHVRAYIVWHERGLLTWSPVIKGATYAQVMGIEKEAKTNDTAESEECGVTLEPSILTNASSLTGDDFDDSCSTWKTKYSPIRPKSLVTGSILESSGDSSLLYMDVAPSSTMNTPTPGSVKKLIDKKEEEVAAVVAATTMTTSLSRARMRKAAAAARARHVSSLTKSRSLSSHKSRSATQVCWFGVITVPVAPSSPAKWDLVGSPALGRFTKGEEEKSLPMAEVTIPFVSEPTSPNTSLLADSPPRSFAAATADAVAEPVNDEEQRQQQQALNTSGEYSSVGSPSPLRDIVFQGVDAYQSYTSAYKNYAKDRSSPTNQRTEMEAMERLVDRRGFMAPTISANKKKKQTAGKTMEEWEKLKNERRANMKKLVRGDSEGGCVEQV